MIELKSTREITHMRAAGRILVEVKDLLRRLVRVGISTKDIDSEVEALLRARGMGFHRPSASWPRGTSSGSTSGVSWKGTTPIARLLCR